VELDVTASLTKGNLPFWPVILTGMLVRLLWVFFVPVVPVSDSAAYVTFAMNIWQHGVYGWTPQEPTAYWPIGTSALTAATFFLLGETFAGVVVLNLVTGFAILVLTWALGDRYFGTQAAFWAVLLVTCWPNLIFFTSILSSELYFIALTMGGLYFWSRENGKIWLNLVLAGLVWGLACYIRPVILLFPVAMAIAAVSQGPRATAVAAVRAAVCVGLITLIVSPWTARNEAVIGKPYLVSSNFGPNFWMGNNPASKGSYMPLPEEVRGMSEVEREEYLSQEAKDFIRENPGRFATLVGKRLLDLHSRETIGVVWNEEVLLGYVGNAGLFMLKLIASGYWVMLVLGALAGVALRVGSAGPGALFHPVFGGWAYFTAIHAITVSGDRYHMPSAPFVALLAGVTAAALVHRFATTGEEKL
jgi:hypothetical protein